MSDPVTQEQVRQLLSDGKDFLSIMKDYNLSLEAYVKIVNQIAKQSNNKYRKQSLDILPFRLDLFIERMSQYKKYCDNTITDAITSEKPIPVEFIKMGSDLELAMFKIENEIYQGLIMNQMTREQLKKHLGHKSELTVKKEQGHVF